MNAYIPFFIIFALLLTLELLYFRIADRFNPECCSKPGILRKETNCYEKRQ